MLLTIAVVPFGNDGIVVFGLHLQIDAVNGVDKKKKVHTQRTRRCETGHGR
jgi:hypothetical protein